MQRHSTALSPGLLIALALAVTAGAADAAAIVELQTAAGRWQGCSLAHDAQRCWLMERSGELREIRLSEVIEHRVLSGTFRPETVVEARDRLRRNVPPDMEVAAKGRYVICAPRGQAAGYATLLDEVYNSFWMFFSRRNFGLKPPEYPLIACIYPTREQFAEHARRELGTISPNLAGYYHRRTNRITLFAPAASTSSAVDGRPLPTSGITLPTAAIASIEAGARETLIHEATHQLAYNSGLHARIGETPRWVVEGLAMLFEEDSRRSDLPTAKLEDRVNRQRYIWFMNYRQSRRAGRSLTVLLEGDDLYRSAPLDFYSESWALAFYLAETRPAEFSRYLRSMAGRDPLSPYSAAEKVADFQAAFGRDLERLDGQFLLFVDRIKLK